MGAMFRSEEMVLLQILDRNDACRDVVRVLGVNQPFAVRSQRTTIDAGTLALLSQVSSNQYS